MTSTATQPRITIFAILDGANLNEAQRDLAYAVYDLARQLDRKLDEMAKDVENSKRQLAGAIHQFMPSAISPQTLVDVAVLNTQLAAAHEAAMRAGVSDDTRLNLTTAAVTK